ncbi:MAG: SGNH/GDSL hydrolase family protein [Oligoflexales bacterium]|nr:SGNH/GDSL hydrolase family protein [Oligoflexales bacterium]
MTKKECLYNCANLALGSIFSLIMANISGSSLLLAQNAEVFDTEAQSIKGQEGTEVMVIGAVGDSITSAFNAKFPLNNKVVSWSTGTNTEQSHSHYMRLKKLFPNKILKSYNESFPGIQAHQLLPQIQKLNKQNPDYVAFTIGANDVCHTPKEQEFNVARFTGYVEQSLETLIKANPDIKIVMGLIPDVINLRKKALDRPYCRAIWSTLAPCKTALHPDLTEADLELFREKWLIANDALVEVGNKFPANVKVPPAKEANYEFDFDLISPIDCFHPNTEGQNILSELTWKYGWY